MSLTHRVVLQARTCMIVVFVSHVASTCTDCVREPLHTKACTKTHACAFTYTCTMRVLDHDVLVVVLLVDPVLMPPLGHRVLALSSLFLCFFVSLFLCCFTHTRPRQADSCQAKCLVLTMAVHSQHKAHRVLAFDRILSARSGPRRHWPTQGSDYRVQQEIAVTQTIYINTICANTCNTTQIYR